MYHETRGSYRHRTITQDDLVFIRNLIAEHPNTSRWELSRKLCRAWNWVQDNGALRDMVCRSMMLMLHRQGLIELPAVRRIQRNPMVDRVAFPRCHLVCPHMKHRRLRQAGPHCSRQEGRQGRAAVTGVCEGKLIEQAAQGCQGLLRLCPRRRIRNGECTGIEGAEYPGRQVIAGRCAQRAIPAQVFARRCAAIPIIRTGTGTPWAAVCIRPAIMRQQSRFLRVSFIRNSGHMPIWRSVTQPKATQGNPRSMLRQHLLCDPTSQSQASPRCILIGIQQTFTASSRCSMRLACPGSKGETH